MYVWVYLPHAEPLVSTLVFMSLFAGDYLQRWINPERSWACVGAASCVKIWPGIRFVSTFRTSDLVLFQKRLSGVFCFLALRIVEIYSRRLQGTREKSCQSTCFWCFFSSPARTLFDLTRFMFVVQFRRGWPNKSPWRSPRPCSPPGSASSSRQRTYSMSVRLQTFTSFRLFDASFPPLSCTSLSFISLLHLCFLFLSTVFGFMSVIAITSFTSRTFALPLLSSDLCSPPQSHVHGDARRSEDEQQNRHQHHVGGLQGGSENPRRVSDADQELRRTKLLLLLPDITSTCVCVCVQRVCVRLVSIVRTVVFSPTTGRTLTPFPIKDPF